MTVVAQTPGVGGAAQESPQLPLPGRDLASEQALIKEAHRRRRRRRLVIAGIVVVLVAGAVPATVSLVGGRAAVARLGSGAGGARFGPPLSTRGGQTTMVIRLPDGRGFALNYPRSLNLGRFDLTAGGQVNWPDPTGNLECCDEYLAPYYGSIASLFTGGPLAVYRRAAGQGVPYYAGTQAKFPYTDPSVDYLAFSFGRWAVLVPDRRSDPYRARMTDQQRSTWASAFDAHVTKGGYLIFSPKPPLQVLRGAIDVTLRGNDGLIEIAGPQTCASTQLTPQLIPAGRAWCDSGAGVHISVTGHANLVDPASSGLAIRSLASVS
jgi:hypothetical protein